MPSVPGDRFQLVILLLFVLPGVVYQSARSRLRGPSPDDASALNRVLRALGVSATLLGLYAVTVGPHVLHLVAEAQESGGDVKDGTVREVALWALVLLLAVPALLALLLFLLRKVPWPRWLRVTYDPIPRAWDFAFTNVTPSYVRALTLDGRYTGGWYGEDSYVSSYPEPREIFLETAHHMNEDGTFGQEVAGSNGMYIRCDDVRLVELVDPAWDHGVEQKAGTNGNQEVKDRVDSSSDRRIQRSFSRLRKIRLPKRRKAQLKRSH